MINEQLVKSIGEPIFSALQLFIVIVGTVFIANLVVFIILRKRSSLSVIKWTGMCILITFGLSVLLLTILAFI